MEEVREVGTEIKVITIRKPADVFGSRVSPPVLGETVSLFGSPIFPLKVIQVREFRQERSYSSSLTKMGCTISEIARGVISYLDEVPPRRIIRESIYLLVLPRGFFGDRTSTRILGLLRKTQFVHLCSQDAAPLLGFAYANAQPYGEGLVIVHEPINGHRGFLTIENTCAGARILGTVSGSLPDQMRPVVAFDPC